MLDLQLADVRIMRRAQWFLINLPMLRPGVQGGPPWTFINAWEPGSAMSLVVIHALPLMCEEELGRSGAA
jgi:hypothetical protein